MVAMGRRHFMRGLTLATAAALPGWARVRAVALADDDTAGATMLHIGDMPLARVPADFMGLGYEISSVARPGLLSPSNRVYVQLVRTLGVRGVVRVGGNTSDDASYLCTGVSRSAPVGTVINRHDLEELGGFLRATGWRLLWGLNLGTGSREAAIEEAAAVARAAGDHLLGFEIGNEVDLFRGNPKHRSPQYGYEDFLREFRAYRDAVRKRLPHARFAGPDAASATAWVERLAVDEGSSMALLTHHYYRECQSATSTLEKLLRPDPKLDPQLKRLQIASRRSGVPYRICEVNSFCGGGRPGVSDTLGAALWVLDFMCRLAAHGCGGVNLETGVNQLNFISSYSPIADDEHGRYRAAPEFYGMLLFCEAAKGEVLPVTWDPGTANATVYAFRAHDSERRVLIINKDARATVRAALPGVARQVMRLEGPGLASRDGVTLGGSSVALDGTWSPRPESVRAAGRTVVLPPSSAALVLLGQHPRRYAGAKLSRGCQLPATIGR